MDDLIEIVNQLQDVFAASNYSGIDLPQVVVIGSQSSGKSSVLEHIVGKSFLPRGTGIVTRCPLVLQLVHAPEETNEEYAIFTHDKTKKFTDYNLICKEIEDQTDRLAGENKGICEISINLKIYSPSFINLTLVDLPGLTKVPVGEQPPDIEDQIKNLTLKYIENPKSIILAVSPANVDMATSESLKIAKDVDQEGKRTLAVITKLDLMDKGTDGWDMLNGKVIPVKLGIIGVVNRSQKDIHDNKSIEKSLKDEAEFFKMKYGSIAKNHGNKVLTKKVQEILINHIKSCMPDLRQKIQEKLLSKNEELEKIKDTKLEKSKVLLDLLTKFSTVYISAVKGHLTDIYTNKLYGGARINEIFHSWLPSALKEFDPRLDQFSGFAKDGVLKAIKNASGVSSSIFVPQEAFELFVKKQIEKLENPCLQSVNMVHKEMSKILQDCIEDANLGLERYPNLPDELVMVVNELLAGRLSKTKEMVKKSVKVELAYINTSHPDFLANQTQSLDEYVKPLPFSSQKFQDQFNSLQALAAPGRALPFSSNQFKECFNSLLALAPNQDRESRDYTLIKELFLSYFSIVRKTIEDIVPKIIMYCLVNKIMQQLHNELLIRLFKKDTEDLLMESKNTVEKREELIREVAALEKASSIIRKLLPVGVKRRWER